MLIKRNIASFICLFALNFSHFNNLKAMEPNQVNSYFSEDVVNSLKKYCKTNELRIIKKLDHGTCSSEIILLEYETPEKKTNVLVLKFLRKGDIYQKSLENERFACEKLKDINCENICPPMYIIELENEDPIVIYRFVEGTSFKDLTEFVQYSDINKKEIRSSEDMLNIFKDLLNKKINAITYLFNQGILYVDAHSKNWILACKKNDNGKSIEPILIDFGSLLDIHKMSEECAPSYYLYPLEYYPITNKALSFFIGSVLDDWEDLMPLCIQKDYGRLPSLCGEILKSHDESQKNGRTYSFTYDYPVTLKGFLNILTSLSQLSPWLLSEKPKSELDKNLVNFVNQYLPELVK